MSPTNLFATHKIREWLRWEGTSRDHVVQPPWLKQGQLEVGVQDWVLSISTDGVTQVNNFQLN